MKICNGQLHGTNNILIALLNYAFNSYKDCNKIWENIEYVLDEFKKDVKWLYVNLTEIQLMNELNKRLSAMQFLFLIKFVLNDKIDQTIIDGYPITNCVWFRPTRLATKDLFYFDLTPTFSNFMIEATPDQWYNFKDIIKSLFAFNLFFKKINNMSFNDIVDDKSYLRFNSIIPYYEISYTNSLAHLNNISEGVLKIMKQSRISASVMHEIINIEKMNLHHTISFDDENINNWVNKQYSNFKTFVSFLEKNFDIYFNIPNPTGGVYVYN